MSEQYFVKYKGRLQGPFSVDQLKTLMKRGKLTRSHLVSEDRKTWVALGDINGIRKEPPHSPTPEQIQTPEIQTAAETPANVPQSPTHQHPDQPQQFQQQPYSLDDNQAFAEELDILQRHRVEVVA